MEPADSAKQQNEHFQLQGVTTIIFAILGTAYAWGELAGRWASYGWLDKAVAIVLVTGFVLLPLKVILKERRRGKWLEALGKADLTLAYVWVLLATLLFKHG